MASVSSAGAQTNDFWLRPEGFIGPDKGRWIDAIFSHPDAGELLMNVKPSSFLVTQFAISENPPRISPREACGLTD
jgi:hypothetical protein